MMPFFSQVGLLKEERYLYDWLPQKQLNWYNKIKCLDKPVKASVSSVTLLSAIRSPSEVQLSNSVRTAKKTPHFTVTKINRLTLFKEIILVY
jgi:hypothetical protein